MIRDTAAQNKSLDNDYGATKGANAAASHTLRLYAGDPTLDGTLLTATGGWVEPTLTNDGTTWPAASLGQKTSARLTLPTSTGAWSDIATHWELLGADGAVWDTGRLSEPIDISAAGVTKYVTLTIFYATRS